MTRLKPRENEVVVENEVEVEEVAVKVEIEFEVEEILVEAEAQSDRQILNFHEASASSCICFSESASHTCPNQRLNTGFQWNRNNCQASRILLVQSSN